MWKVELWFISAKAEMEHIAPAACLRSQFAVRARTGQFATGVPPLSARGGVPPLSIRVIFAPLTLHS